MTGPAATVRPRREGDVVCTCIYELGVFAGTVAVSDPVPAGAKLRVLR